MPSTTINHRAGGAGEMPSRLVARTPVLREHP
jgi:hypothetical protein